MTRYAFLLATGSYLPEREISNDLLRERFTDSADLPADLIDKFEASTGIRKRWWAPEEASRRARFQIALGDVLPVENEHVVLRVHAHAAQSSEHPAVRQRLRPREIGLVARCAGLRVH